MTAMLFTLALKMIRRLASGGGSTNRRPKLLS